MNEEQEKQDLLVRFACGGATLADRKNCICYADHEYGAGDDKFTDCAGLENPNGNRDGFCWDTRAVLARSFQFVEDYDKAVKAEQSQH